MSHPFVLVIASEKGGVGKTTLATNLAIFLKALSEDLPVTLVSFDNHFSVDRMFRIGQGKPRGDVAALLRGAPAEGLVQTGEFGVQFISSSRELALLREEFAAPDLLARALAGSRLDGVFIVDTRPELDTFTRNALYAADRVIVPVKDAPSLENCRYLYEFFDQERLSRQTLKILPSLIDFRIQYAGPFRDPQQLMRAYAINRGYRCFEECISKSPKVESLNTNPEGRILPLLTHGRGTEVHQQYARIATTLLGEIRAEGPRRIAAFRRQLAQGARQVEEAFARRLEHLAPGCLVCGKALEQESGQPGHAGYYAETSDGRVHGFLGEDCFTRLVFANFYGSAGERQAGPALEELFRESARRSWFVLRRAPGTRGFFEQQLSFVRFDEEGLELSHKTFALKTLPDARENGALGRLLGATLCDSSGMLGDAFLVIRRVSAEIPQEILLPGPYAQLTEVVRRIRTQFPTDA